jgi:hypothetical protein
MAFWCMFFIRFLMLDFGMFSLVRFPMECSCMAPLNPVVMVKMGLVFQPLFGWCYLMGRICFGVPITHKMYGLSLA